MLKKSRSHIRSVNESYFQHMGVAFRYGLTCLSAGVMAILHGLIPALFATSASEKVRKLAEKGRK